MECVRHRLNSCDCGLIPVTTCSVKDLIAALNRSLVGITVGELLTGASSINTLSPFPVLCRSTLTNHVDNIVIQSCASIFQRSREAAKLVLKKAKLKQVFESKETGKSLDQRRYSHRALRRKQAFRQAPLLLS
jgi:hypothetical protein